jgi:hypothetical protein
MMETRRLAPSLSDRRRGPRWRCSRPDFKLHINGGADGILVVTLGADVCAASPTDRVGTQEFNGQNGKEVVTDFRAENNCPFGVTNSSHTASALRIIADLSLPLSRATRRTLAKGHNVSVKVKVRYMPKDSSNTKGIATTKTVYKHVTIHVPQGSTRTS